MEKEIRYSTIDEYIRLYPPDVRQKLEELRAVIKSAAPDAQEKISWGMPTFYLDGNLVHFAAHKNHIGFYPGASGVEAFLKETAEYKTSKGAVQLPLDKPLPKEIIFRVTAIRAKENLNAKKK